jgi:cytochrome P450
MIETPRPPGPRGLPLFGPILEYTRDPFAFLENLRLRYGDVAFTQFAGLDAYLLSEPDAIEHVLVRNKQNYPKSELGLRLRSTIGQGLLTSDGDLWTRQRKLIAPAFHHKRIATYAGEMVRATEAHAAAWRPGRLRLDKAMMDLTLDIAVRTLFGADAGDDGAAVGEAFTRASEYYAVTLTQPFPMPLFVPTPRNKSFLRARETMFDVVRRIIARKRRQTERGDDLLSTLIDATDESGAGMSDDQLRDEVLTLLLAGHETTALTLTYAFDQLARHPEARAALEAEVDEVLGDRSPTFEDMGKLVYTERVVKEAMRLFPPAAVLGRQAIEDDVIAGWKIPAGSMVAMAQWVVHRDPRWFEEPRAFRPDRWTRDFEDRLPRFAYFPFGGGPRICVGAAFAMMEAKLALAAITRRYRMALLDPRPLELLMSVTVRPKRPVEVALSPRGRAE